MGEVVYGVVFGKPKSEANPDQRVVEVYGPLSRAAVDVFSDDVQHLPPLFNLPAWSLPCDTEPSTDEYNEPPCA